MTENSTPTPTRISLGASLLLLSLAVGLFAVPNAHGEEAGVLCRFTGQQWPPQTDPAESWNRRWDFGPGVEQINDDCEAVIQLGGDPAPQWVASVMAPRLSYVKTRTEVGVSEDFDLPPGAKVVFMELFGKRLAHSGPPPPFLLRVALARPIDGHPGDYELRFEWNSDDDEGVYVDGPHRLERGTRLLVRMDWVVSTDRDRDFQPDRDGRIAFSVEGVERYVESSLVIDQTSATGVAFGYHSGAPADASGNIYLLPLGIDTGYFSRN